VDVNRKRNLILSGGWIQAAIVVILIGFTILLYLPYRAGVDAPPIPSRITDPSGQVLFTGQDILAGQQVFLSNGLMEYGSIFGHGAYLGPDFTADYLRKAATRVRDQFGGVQSDQAVVRTIADFKTNRYDAATDTLAFSAAQSTAFSQTQAEYQQFFGDPSTENGLRPGAIADPNAVHQLTAFFAWSAWAASTTRPGQSYSYTNNWPAEPLVANQPTADNVIWSMLSLAALLGGIGALFAAFGRWNVLGWHGAEQRSLSFFAPGEVALVHLARRQQGLIVPKGNPRGVHGLEDLARGELLFLNRQRGSGTRQLLDFRLRQLGIAPEHVQGYHREAYTHLAVAAAVASGGADAGLGILAAARALDLDFIPVGEEQYDLALRTDSLDHPAVACLLATIRSTEFRSAAEGLGGYDMREAGERRL